MMYEDEVCSIFYQLWAEGGRLSYTIQNKTTQILYLDLDKSFFIKNGIAQDYYVDRTIENSASDVSSIGHSVSGFYTLYSIATSSTSMLSESIREHSILAIPPKASKVISMFTIASDLFLDCDLYRYPADSASISFSEEDSPIRFSNYLTYHLGMDPQERAIENKFYVSRISNYAKPTFAKYVRRENKPCQNMTDEVGDEYRPKYAVEVYDLIYDIDISNCFYNRYDTESRIILYKDITPKNLHYDKQYNGYIRYANSEREQYVQKLTNPFAKPQ
jgi:hypothetical protein